MIVLLPESEIAIFIVITIYTDGKKSITHVS